MLVEEDRPLVPGISVKAASMDALLCLLIDSFLPNGCVKENSKLPRVVLLMHQWFTSSEHLAQSLISRFWHYEAVSNCHSSCIHSYAKVTDCMFFHYRACICQTFRYWIGHFPIHFDLNATLVGIVQEFQTHLLNNNFGVLAHLLDLTKLTSCDWARSMSVRNSSSKHTRKISLVFDHLEPSELADHITFLEHKVMRRITFSDFKCYAECGTPQDHPKLERSISLFNGLSQWIQWMVLSKALPQQRAHVIVKFVHVAQKLLQQNNFNSVMCVVGGLSHSALARMTHTMACVPAETRKTLSQLTQLLSSASNFSSYRQALLKAKGFKIPILGVHMKDLIALHVALPDTLESGLVNFRKIAQLSLIFQELWELQNSVPDVSVNADLVNTLRLSLETPCTEDELYEMSLAKEPRTPPAKLATPLEDTMVEVILKSYDVDSENGALSPRACEAFLSHFPSFSNTDSCRISRAELKQWLLTANSESLRIAFQHDFNETTYFKPTFCAHCAGLLFGLIKQGFKCRDCGINAHKHCKEVVVMPCRSDATKLKPRIPWRRPLKSSQSDESSTHSCSCDDGFVLEPTPSSKLSLCACKLPPTRPNPLMTVETQKSKHSTL